MTSSPEDGAAGVRISETRTVTSVEAVEIADLAAAATAVDGTNPLDDQVRTELGFGAGPQARHVLARAGDLPAVVAYSHASFDDSGLSAHLVVHPDYRRHGVGTALADHLVGLLPIDDTSRQVTARVWAHGDTDGAKALAAALGFVRVRDLWQMRRPLSMPLADPSYPDDVGVRTFEPGQDDDAWVALNALAFASHPEQGRLTVEDLWHRMGEPWFDARGFFLAERDGKLVGSHWTKVHSAEETGGEPVGEVYAVGVHPGAQGLGLGKALTLTGLRYLRDLGLSEVMLYVDGDNQAAVRLYERLDFTTTTIDAMYAGSTRSSPAPR